MGRKIESRAARGAGLLLLGMALAWSGQADAAKERSVGRRVASSVKFKPPGTVPLPRPRPLLVPPRRAPQGRAAPDVRAAPEAAPPRPPPAASATTCRGRLAAGLAVAAALPPISGPGGCGTADPVRLEAIMTPAGRRIALSPAAVVDCSTAEAVANWVRDEVVPAFPAPGAQLAGIAVAAAYECRGRNRVAGAKISQHGYGKAIDLSALTLTDGSKVGLTDKAADMALRTRLRESGCRRFTTVLGPGSDGYHEAHIHFDVIVRRSGYRICQWDIR
ncbi:MAG: extensin family protein [Rhizobiales bacterium]|nr:extensin family protein [Hyphomicrobiales bacterium]